MKKRILIVGGVAGGASVAARVRRLDENAEIIIFEKGPHVSFSNCSLPFHLSGIVENADDLVMMDPAVFKSQYNIVVKVNHEVLSINRAKKTVEVKDHTSNKTITESYDKLILSPGANPVLPKSIEGINLEHVFTVRNVVDISKIKQFIDTKKINDICVVGGGFIGIEVAENLKLANKNVTLVEALNQIVTPLDYDMVQILHKEMHDKGVNLILEDGVKSITKDHVELTSGKKIPSGAVIMSIGVKPETTLAVAAGLTLGETGAIAVNHHYQTNDPDIYAVGDAIEVTHFITRKKTRLTLAGPAQRQARAVANHIYGQPYRNTGVIGSSVIRCFDYNAAFTGLNEKDCIKHNIPYNFVYIIPKDKVGLMPEANPFHFKLIFEEPSGQILGAQAIGKGNVDKRIDVIAAMIMMHGNLEDLKELELGYSPLFSTAKDPVNMAALVGLNVLNGAYKQVPVTKVRELVESKAFIIDAREKWEYDEGHLKTAINIPLTNFRDHLDKVPKDRPVYIHCLSSQRSYFFVRALELLGYTNIYNISGSFLGICMYEYFTDITKKRDPIVTAYRFKLLG